MNKDKELLSYIAKAIQKLADDPTETIWWPQVSINIAEAVHNDIFSLQRASQLISAISQTTDRYAMELLLLKER